MAKSFKIILIGDGKTNFFNSLFSDKSKPTIHTDFQSLNFESNYGELTFNVWDGAGLDRCNSCSSHYLKNANAAICVYQSINPEITIKEFRSSVPNLPIIICSNLIYSPEVKMENVEYYGISKQKLFQQLARKLTGKKDLKFL